MKSGEAPRYRAYHAAWYAAHAESERAKRLERYYALDGPGYNETLMKNRRYKALARMAERHAPKEQGG